MFSRVRKRIWGSKEVTQYFLTVYIIANSRSDYAVVCVKEAPIRKKQPIFATTEREVTAVKLKSTTT